MVEDIKSSDPRIQLEEAKEEELVVLKKLKEKEAEIRILSGELKALRSIKEEAVHHIEEEADEDEEKEEERRKREAQEQETIDNLVEDVQLQRGEGSNDNPYQSNAATQPLYNIPGSEEVKIASDSNTINELYALAEKETHTKEEKKRFFDITSAIVKSKPYEMNPVVAQRVDNTYQALKSVIEKRPDLTTDYKPIETKSSVNEFLTALKKSPVTNYKL